VTALLGTLLDGDLTDVAVRGPRGPLGQMSLVGLSFQQLSAHGILIGGTGTGKTKTALRLAEQLMGEPLNPTEPPIRILFVDAKGLARGDRDLFVALARHHGYQRITTWPEEALAGLNGSVHELRERLSGLWDSTESGYHFAEAVTMLDLALAAGETPRSLGEVIERTRPGVTAALYEAQATMEGLVKKGEASSFSSSQWNSVYLRLRALAATVGDRLDSTTASWTLEQVDAAWISIPGTSAPQMAGDVASWLLALIGELAAHGDGRPTFVVLDEFSAVGGDQRASRAAAGLVERTRSAGVALLIGAQTIASLGEHADRLLQTAGTIICHRTPVPDGIVELAGTLPVWEDTQNVDAFGTRVASSGRRQQQYRVAPDLLRSLPIGEAVVIRAGRWAHVAVTLPVPS
jgi:hypothetical protein